MKKFYPIVYILVHIIFLFSTHAFSNTSKAKEKNERKEKAKKLAVNTIRLKEPLLKSNTSSLKSIKPYALDPIKFIMRANKDSVTIGEEIEITITAQLLDIPPNVFFFFEEQKGYIIKVIMPEGFVQTGGNYYDYIGEPKIAINDIKTYTLKGYFNKNLTNSDFILLRGPKDGHSGSVFERKGAIFIKSIKDNYKKKGRVAISPCYPTLEVKSKKTVGDPNVLCNGDLSLQLDITNCYGTIKWQTYGDQNWGDYSANQTFDHGNYQFKCVVSCDGSDIESNPVGFAVERRNTPAGYYPDLVTEGLNSDNENDFTVNHCFGDTEKMLFIDDKNGNFRKPYYKAYWAKSDGTAHSDLNGDENQTGIRVSYPDTYKVKIITVGCPGQETGYSVTATVNVGSRPNINVNTTGESCNGDNVVPGRIDISTTGQGAMEYRINSNGTWTTSNSISLWQGNYTVYARSSNNLNCEGEYSDSN